MIRVAIPIFKSRVSPVFDSCTRVLLVDMEQHREIARNEIYLDEFSLIERVNILQKSQITTIICGGISEVMQNMLKNLRINLITGIAGEVKQVVDAYMSGQLDDSKFRMPGYMGKFSIPHSF
jgi:predicted Fe-Mo cluster-binding NifX family protein